MGENLFSVNRPLYNYFLLIETQKKKKKKKIGNNNFNNVLNITNDVHFPNLEDWLFQKWYYLQMLQYQQMMENL